MAAKLMAAKLMAAKLMAAKLTAEDYEALAKAVDSAADHLRRARAVEGGATKMQQELDEALRQMDGLRDALRQAREA